MRKEYKIRISGFGGQGVVLSGWILGRAASLYDGKNAAFTQSYGPEARGGACTGCLVIGKEEIAYPLVKKADFLIALSMAGYKKYVYRVASNALIFVDVGLVSEAIIDNKRIFGIPATKFAEEMGNKIVANIIMLGFFCSLTRILSKAAMLKSIRSSVKKDFVDINLKAFERGYKYGSRIRENRVER